jgi:hypothetical protein
MQRIDFYTLTIHRPGCESPSEFHFAKPPSRADFLTLCRHLPWTVVWTDTIIRYVAENHTAWPMVDFAHKAASCDLTDESGNVVGRINVSRDTLYQGDSYCRSSIFISVDDEHAVTSRLPKAKREEAGMALMRGANRAKEMLSLMDNPTADDRRAALRSVLVEAGIIGKPRKSKATA